MLIKPSFNVVDLVLVTQWVIFKYELETKKRNLPNLEPEASVASGGFLIAKISLLSL